MSDILELHEQEKALRSTIKDNIVTYNEVRPKSEHIESNDKDYVFIHFILNYLPIGLIGLLIAVIFSASMSSTSAELNALATISVVDIYKRSFAASNISDQQYLRASRVFTFIWGLLAILFAISASLFENLIQAVNILGSIFYGTVLGIFVVAFFMKWIKGQAVFIAALIVQVGVICVFYLNHIGVVEIAFLWLNAIGCLGVMALASVIQLAVGREQ